MELPEPSDADAGQVFSAAFFASLWDFCELSQHLADMRAGLSTRQNSCECSVSMGAGLPTPRGSWFLRLWLDFAT